MLKFNYYLSNLVSIHQLETGALSKASLRLNSKTKVLHFKIKYSHNFWTEIRGGKRINTFEVFKSKYTYLDQ